MASTFTKRPQRILWLTAALTIALALATLPGLMLDSRLVTGVNPWIKPPEIRLLSGDLFPHGDRHCIPHSRRDSDFHRVRETTPGSGKNPTSRHSIWPRFGHLGLITGVFLGWLFLDLFTFLQALEGRPFLS